jgi:hypothetical protein
VANYEYFDGQRWHEINNVPAHLVEVPSNVLQAFNPGPVIEPYKPVLPLYAAPIQGAIASGDLAQMKSLSAQARQQLEQLPLLRKAVDDANKEISRVQSR